MKYWVMYGILLGGLSFTNIEADSLVDAIEKKKTKWDNGLCKVQWGYVSPPNEWKHIYVGNSSSGNGRHFFNSCSTDTNGNPCIKSYNYDNSFDDKECFTFHPPTLEEVKHCPKGSIEIQGGKSFYYSTYAADENYACIFQIKQYENRVDVKLLP